MVNKQSLFNNNKPIWSQCPGVRAGLMLVGHAGCGVERGPCLPYSQHLQYFWHLQLWRIDWYKCSEPLKSSAWNKARDHRLESDYGSSPAAQYYHLWKGIRQCYQAPDAEAVAWWVTVQLLSLLVIYIWLDLVVQIWSSRIKSPLWIYMRATNSLNMKGQTLLES